MASETAITNVSSQNDRLKIFLHALLFVAGFSLVFIVGWGGSVTVLGQLFGTYKRVIAQIGGVVVIMGARNGILVRNRLSLEAARNIDVVVFDKTGTLTEGKFGVVGISTENWDENSALALAAAIEGDSEHLIARAIRNASTERNAVLPSISNFSVIKGRGVQAVLDGKSVYVGGPRVLEMLKLSPSQTLASFADDAGQKAQSVVFLVMDAEVVAAFAVADVIRPESKQAVQRLHTMGMEVAMTILPSTLVPSLPTLQSLPHV